MKILDQLDIITITKICSNPYHITGLFVGDQEGTWPKNRKGKHFTGRGWETPPSTHSNMFHSALL